MDQSALSPQNQAFCIALADFCDRNNISRRHLGRLLRISVTAVQRLLHQNEPDHITTRKRAECGPILLDLLRDKGLNHADIAEELACIYELEDFVMIADRCALTPEAIRYFGLKHDPFDVDRLPVGDELFTNADLDSVAGRVRDAVLYQRFVAVVGNIGSGKTLLKLRIDEELQDKARLLYPEFYDQSEVSVSAIANMILAGLGQKIPRDKGSRVSRIKEVLVQMQQEGTPVALVIDECHRLNDKVISSLKNFWEMTNGRTTRLLGVLLFGQPQFVDARLRDVVFKEIRQRVQVLQMPDLKKQAGEYLHARIAYAGGDFDSLFEKAAVTRIAANATTPLAIGNLANEALMDAMEQEEKRVTVSLPSFRKLSTGDKVVGVRRAA